MKFYLVVGFALAFLSLLTLIAPVVVEGASRHVTKTVVRREGVSLSRARKYERSYASDCDGLSRSSSDCDLGGMRSSTCDGAARASRRTVEITIR